MRKFTWFVFVPALLFIIYFILAFFSGFSMLFSFGQVDAYRLQISLSKVVMYISSGLLLLSIISAKIALSADEKSRTGAMMNEIASICTAIFFGGFFTLAFTLPYWWLLVIWSVMYVSWIYLIEVPKPKKKDRRPWKRLFSLSAVSAAIFVIVHHIAY